ncbi:MAG: DUF3576 domain-containing protein [Hyphomicrobiales bacterium]|nr:DUF3576 domain-containing protein [Hyphomicrobiales bacterium]
MTCGARNFALIIMASILASCSGLKPDAETNYPMDPNDARREKRGSLTGGEGLQLFGGGNKEASGSSIGVNSYLWRASLDTVSFMPLASVDPHGGVIITDWYEDPDIRGSRYKLNVVILGETLRADGVRVSVFRQSRDGTGGWRDAKVDDAMARQLEDAILTRARELKIAHANG